MKIIRILAIIVIMYLVVSLPLYFLNQQAIEKCSKECKKEGYDIVISATFVGQKECRCLDSLTRKEKILAILKEN